MREQIIKKADEILKQGQERVTPEVGDVVFNKGDHLTLQFVEGVDWNDLPRITIDEDARGIVSYVTTFWGIHNNEFHVTWDIDPRDVVGANIEEILWENELETVEEDPTEFYWESGKFEDDEEYLVIE